MLYTAFPGAAVVNSVSSYQWEYRVKRVVHAGDSVFLLSLLCFWGISHILACMGLCWKACRRIFVMQSSPSFRGPILTTPGQDCLRSSCDAIIDERHINHFAQTSFTTIITKIEDRHIRHLADTRNMDPAGPRIPPGFDAITVITHGSHLKESSVFLKQ